MAAPDGGWGWMAVVGTFMIYIILGGIQSGFGVWYVEILDRFEASSALSEWLIGVHCALRLMLYPVVTMLYARVPLRVLGLIGGLALTTCLFASAFAETFLQLFIAFGVMGGIAGSFVSYASKVVILEYFDKRKTLAMGIGSSGSGIGGFIFSPFLSYCFSNLSYFETITLMAGISMQSLVAVALFFPAYEEVPVDTCMETLPLLEEDSLEKENSPKLLFANRLVRKPKMISKVRKAQGKRLFEPDLLWNPVMLLYMLGSFVTTMGTFSVLQLVVHFAVTRGETLESASMLLTGTGLTEFSTRVLGGILFNLAIFNQWIVPVWNCCPAFVGLSAVLITLCYSFWEFLPVVLFTSFSFANLNSLAPLIFNKVFEKEAFGPAFSMYSNANGIGILCGTYLAGYMKDAIGSYEASYYMMAALSGTASLVYWMAYLLMKRAKKTFKYRVYVSFKA